MSTRKPKKGDRVRVVECYSGRAHKGLIGTVSKVDSSSDQVYIPEIGNGCWARQYAFLDKPKKKVKSEGLLNASPEKIRREMKTFCDAKNAETVKHYCPYCGKDQRV